MPDTTKAVKDTQKKYWVSILQEMGVDKQKQGRRAVQV